jgi:hypothetical protein
MLETQASPMHRHFKMHGNTAEYRPQTQKRTAAVTEWPRAAVTVTVTVSLLSLGSSVTVTYMTHQ